jgi:hypothetical protein
MSTIGKALSGSLWSAARTSQLESCANSQAITGGNLPKQPYQHFGNDKLSMPHMPLDTEIHWDWRNPLNLIPGAIVAIIILDILALIFS